MKRNKNENEKKEFYTKSNYSLLLFQSTSPIQSSTNYIYVTKTDILETSVNKGVYKDFGISKKATFPTFLIDYETIKIPKGVRRILERKTPKRLLDKISYDRSRAIELCLLFTSYLMPSMYFDKWINLSSKKLHEITKASNDNTFVYKYVIEALKYSSDKVPSIIDVKSDSNGKESYQVDFKSKSYKISDFFHGKRFETYKLKNKPLLIVKRKEHFYKLKNALENPIGKNLIKLYQRISLPNDEEILSYAKKLVKSGYKSKKGKELKFLNNKKKEDFKNNENISFVEKALTKYHFLVGDGFRIPEASYPKAGGRVSDSFNLMSSWIRELIKIDEEEIVEVDYKALHPNLATKIYEGRSRFILHQDVANSLNLEVKEVKIEHLSFFNKHPKQMEKSILYNYYKKYEPEMLENIIKDKYNNNYKITSKRMFELEVKIMSDVIKALNKKGIYVGYVYDALFCKKSDREIVKRVMNEEILKNNVYTIAD